MRPARIGVPPERALAREVPKPCPLVSFVDALLLSLPPPQLAIDFLIAPATDAGIVAGQSYRFKQFVVVHQVTFRFILKDPMTRPGTLEPDEFKEQLRWFAKEVMPAFA
jgi:hypothetical protein